MQVRPGLANTIDVVRKRIQQMRDRKEIIGEQNTKAALIDPILMALGWDLHEIDEIRREYRRKPQDNPVDYALFLNRTESLFIEAKSLEKDLNDRKWISQKSELCDRRRRVCDMKVRLRRVLFLGPKTERV